MKLHEAIAKIRDTVSKRYHLVERDTSLSRALDTILAAFDCAEDERCVVVRVKRPESSGCNYCEWYDSEHHCCWLIGVDGDDELPWLDDYDHISRHKDCPWYEGEDRS